MVLATAFEAARLLRRHWRIWAATVAAMVLPAMAIADGQGPALEDPLPLQRMAIPISRLPAELERVREGVLVKMPRDEFEALVQRAARAGNLAHDVPRLAKAKYAAELVGNSLVHGSGQWTIHQPANTPAALPLANLNLALAKAHWAGGEDAILGNIDGKNFGLWVDKQRELSFGWSLRGAAAAAALQFDLHVPPSTIGTLALTVPADHQILVAKTSVLLSGPHEAKQPDKRIWRLEFGGRSRVEFQVRRPAEAPRAAPLLLSQVQVNQQITPERLVVDFDFQVEVLHGRVRELVFDCDPSLQPFEVSLRAVDLKDWELKEGSTNTKIDGKNGAVEPKPATLVIHLREPFQGKLQGLKIRCLAPNPVDKRWLSAPIQLRQGQLRGESIKLIVHPNVQLEAWDAGSFRLLSSTSESDGTQVLSLVDPAAGFEPSRRPSCRFMSQGFEVSTHQQSWWQIEPEASTLTTDVFYEVRRGSVFQLALELPTPTNSWRVEAVTLEPKEALRSWTTAGPLLLVDLQRGLNPRNPGKLSVRLTRRPQAIGAQPRTLDIPTLKPLDCAACEGTLAVSVDPLFQVSLQQVSASAAAPPTDGPWRIEGRSPPQFYFAYRGQTLTGRLALYPRKPRVPHGSVPNLHVATQAHAQRPPVQEWCTRARLTTFVQAGRPLLHHFSFHAGNWRKRDLVVTLPAPTKQVLAAKVDGRWLEQVVQEDADHGRQIKFPAPMDLKAHRFEIFYLTDVAWSGWPTYADLEVPPPQLPVESPAFERTWQLEPGLVPLHGERWQALSESADLGQDFRRAWHVGDPVLAEMIPAVSEGSFELQRQILLGAEAGLRRKLTKDMSLGEALDRLAHDFLKEQLPLLVDRHALRGADFRPDTSMARSFASAPATTRPFWETLGLVCVPFSSGALLTTRAQLEIWQDNYGSLAEIQHVFDPAVAEASAREHDRTGRFVTLGHWLRTESQSEPALAAVFLPTGKCWTTWVPRPGLAESARLVVVLSASLRSLGIIIGLLSLGLAWRIGRRLSGAWCFRLSVIWLLALGLTLVWLPAALQPALWWALLAAAAGIGCWLVRLILRAPAALNRLGKPTDLAKVLIGSSSLWFLFMPGAWVPQGRSEGPESFHVLLVESEPGQQMVLVAPDLLKKLTELETRGAKPFGALLVSARYEGKRNGNLADFTVQFDIHNFADKAKLLVPLADVDLREGAVLDGVPVFPVTAGGSEAGYLVNLSGKGRHRLVLSFSVRLSSAGGYQELRFTGPRLGANVFEWTTADPAHGLQLVHSMGETRISQPSPASYDLKADLGAEASIHLRWRLKDAPAQAAASEVREAYYWDLRPGSASLSTLLQFAPVKGTLSHLALTLPEDMEIRSVEAISGEPVTASPPVSLLKKWSITGAGADRQLHVDLVGPVAQRVLLSLNLVPRINLAAGNLLLRLPLPVAAKQTESFLAYRLDGLRAEDKTQNLGITSITPDVFGKVWAGFGRTEIGRASRAYSFRRTAAKAGLTLTLSAQNPEARGEVTWTVYPHYADFAATIQLTAAREEQCFVEIGLPEQVNLTSVRGAALHHWSRHKAKVQIWLQQPDKQAALELLGWTPLAQNSTETNSGRFVVPPLAPSNAKLDSLQIKVLPSQGVSLETERLHHLIKRPDPHTFTVEDPDYEGTFQVRLLRVRADVGVLTTAEVREKACIFVSHFSCQASRGNPEPLRILLHHSAGADAGLEVAEPGPHVKQRRVGADQLWELTFPPGTPQPFTFRLRARVPLRDLPEVSMPEVSISGAQTLERWLAVTGPELRPALKTGLVKVEASSTDLHWWPAEAQRIQNGGAAWHMTGVEGGLKLEVQSAASVPPVTVLLAQEQASLGNGLCWLHEAEFLLAVRGEGDLQFALPPDARLVAVTLDGLPISCTAGPETCLVPLGGTPGARTLRVCWRYVGESETLDHPKIGGVYLAGIKSVPRQGRLLIPADFSLSSQGDIAGSSLIEQLLARAQAQLALAHFLVQPLAADAAPALAGAQKKLRWCLRQAEIEIGFLGASEDKRKHSAALAELHKESERLVQQNGFEGLRNQADSYLMDVLASELPMSALPEKGRPFYWKLTDPRQTVAVSLVMAGNGPRRSPRRWSISLVFAAAALLALSYWRRSPAYLAVWWPELWMLSAIAGMFAWGISLTGVVMVALGLTGRLLWAARGLRRWTMPARP